MKLIKSKNIEVDTMLKTKFHSNKQIVLGGYISCEFNTVSKIMLLSLMR